MENASFENKIEYLKKCVNGMLTERASISGQSSTAAPSPIWAEGVSVFTYLMDLPPEHFRNIRFHTGIINGTTWTYWHPYPEPDPEAEAAKIGYLKAIEDVPDEYWASEPPTPYIPRPLGVSYRGRIINRDIVRYQQCISPLYHVKAFKFIKKASEKQFIVEIGGGYGGLAHCIGNIVNTKATYILIDLPETLLFQGAFLTVNNPTKSIYIWNEDTYNPKSFIKEIGQHDFVLLPNYALKYLSGLNEVALLINTQSFQEMTEAQVEEYLSFAHEKVSYCVFSSNLDRHPYNSKLSSVSTLLQKYFKLYPSPQFYEEKYKGLDTLNFLYYKTYIGFPQNSKINVNSMTIPNFPYLPKIPPKVVPRIQPKPKKNLIQKFIPDVIRKRIPHPIKKFYSTIFG